MTNRRDFIKWVVYLGAVAALPALTETKDLATDVLEGLSWTKKRVAGLSDDPVKFRGSEDAAFERYMQEVWRERNGSARYIRVFCDNGLQPARRWADSEGIKHDLPERWESFFQYRRA